MASVEGGDAANQGLGRHGRGSSHRGRRSARAPATRRGRDRLGALRRCRRRQPRLFDQLVHLRGAHAKGNVADCVVGLHRRVLGGVDVFGREAEYVHAVALGVHEAVGVPLHPQSD